MTKSKFLKNLLCSYNLSGNLYRTLVQVGKDNSIFIWTLNQICFKPIWSLAQGVVHKLCWQDYILDLHFCFLRLFISVDNMLRDRSQTRLISFGGFFWPPTPLRWHFLPYERWQKVDPPPLVNVVCERPLTSQAEDPDINFEGCFEDKSKVNNSHFSILYTMGQVHYVSAD